MHELGLLFYSFIARKEGFEVLYLGTSVPVADIEGFLRLSLIQYIYIFGVKLKEERYS